MEAAPVISALGITSASGSQSPNGSSQGAVLAVPIRRLTALPRLPPMPAGLWPDRLWRVCPVWLRPAGQPGPELWPEVSVQALPGLQAARTQPQLPSATSASCTYARPQHASPHRSLPSLLSLSARWALPKFGHQSLSKLARQAGEWCPPIFLFLPATRALISSADSSSALFMPKSEAPRPGQLRWHLGRLAAHSLACPSQPVFRPPFFAGRPGALRHPLVLSLPFSLLVCHALSCCLTPCFLLPPSHPVALPPPPWPTTTHRATSLRVSPLSSPAPHDGAWHPAGVTRNQRSSSLLRGGVRTKGLLVCGAGDRQQQGSIRMTQDGWLRPPDNIGLSHSQFPSFSKTGKPM